MTRERAPIVMVSATPTPIPMNRTIWTFGLIAGAIMSALMVATIPFADRVGFGHSLIVGYTTMVAGFLLVYFGIRSYRDTVGRGRISFGRAFAIGALITLVGSACYTATWEVMYFRYMPDFMEKYGEHQLEQARAAGKSEVELARMREESRQFAARYRNPLFNAALTILEPLPVGLVVTLVSAGILRRGRREEEGWSRTLLMESDPN
jgi:hypothetical protein